MVALFARLNWRRKLPRQASRLFFPLDAAGGYAGRVVLHRQYQQPSFPIQFCYFTFLFFDQFPADRYLKAHDVNLLGDFGNLLPLALGHDVCPNALAN